MRAWPHQAHALEELDKAIAAGEKRICITSPTGGGKTTMAALQFLKGGKHSWYTHRKILAEQSAEVFRGFGLDVGMRAHGHGTSRDPIQVTMVKTEYNRVIKDMTRRVHGADFIWIDEAHHMGGVMMESLLESHGDAVKIGLTATPLGIGDQYDRLIIAGNKSELRDCGALVPAFHYSPLEVHKDLIGKVKEVGDCGIPKDKRKDFVYRIYGHIIKNYRKYNPDRMPGMLFAPGVAESIWICEELNNEGIRAAHIDGSNVWLDGELWPKNQDIVNEVVRRSKSGEIEIVCNRFVLREGVNWPWIYCGLFATIFGGLSSYLQAGGRILRAHPSMDHVKIIDFGGNYWRHGSLNSNQQWDLDHTDRLRHQLRMAALRGDHGEVTEQEPIQCPQCFQWRLSGAECYDCGYSYSRPGRRVLQVDGSLKLMAISELRTRRVAKTTPKLIREWNRRIANYRKNPKLQKRTFSQAAVAFMRDNNFNYPDPTWPGMPINPVDWFRAVSEVDELR
jgi:DNA repair protein RadD